MSLFRQKVLTLSFLGITLLSFAALPLITNAAARKSPLLEEVQIQSDKARQNAGYSDPDDSSVQSAVGRFIGVLTSLIGVILTVLIFYAGSLWFMSGGNDTQIEKAKHILRNSVIGLGILLSAYAITRFVIKMTISSTKTPNYTQSIQDGDWLPSSSEETDGFWSSLQQGTQNIGSEATGN